MDNQPRVLFLDDDPRRLSLARSNWPHAVLVDTADAAIAQLWDGEWDLVSLDHDLGGEVYVDSEREDCGMAVVRYILDARPVIHQIVVHSYNEQAAPLMVSSLRSAGYSACWVPFGHGLAVAECASQ